jgi:hypothetical protein
MITDDILEALTETMVSFKAGVGIESLTEGDQKYISKRNSLQNLFSASASFDKYGGIFRGFFMITPETSREAIKSCSTSTILERFDDLRVTYLVPYPGTPLYEQHKGDLVTNDWSDFDCQRPVLRSNHLTEQELANAQREIVQGFLLNKARQKRLKQKLGKFPHLEPGVHRYHEKMRGYGFETLDI